MNSNRMRILAPAAALLLAAPLGAQTADTLPAATREQIVSELDRNVKRYFAHWEAVPDLDYPREFAAYRARALGTADRRAFSLASMEFMAGLRNGHTGYGDQWLWERDGAPLPLRVARVEGKWAVLWSRVEGVRAGDVVESIDGEPFEDFFRRNRGYVAGSNERAVRYMFGTRSFLFPPRFTLRVAGGREAAVVRQRPATAPAATPARAPALAHRWLVPDSVAYLRVPSFGDGAYQAAALDLLRGEFRRASALVVDLRGNGGGSTPWKLRKALMGGFPHRSRRDGPDRVRPSLLYRMAVPVVLKLYPVPAFRGDLVFLVDGGCASACEDLLLQFKDNGRAVLVGDTTFGSTGQPRFLDLGGGITAQVSARRVRFPDGAPFEGVGVAPDVYLPVTLEGLRSGIDPLPERALALVRSGAARYPRRAPPPRFRAGPPLRLAAPLLLAVFASTAGAQTAPDTVRADTVPVALPGVVASGWRIGGSAQSLSRADWQNAPQPGEDVFRMVTRLPGVSANDLAAKFAVRGGSNDELLVRLDGLELVEPFHLREFEGGALSLVDMEALGSVELIPGGFPARYGNRLTGVFDMRTAALPEDGGRTVVGLSLTNARVLTHQGFAGGKGEWLFSARRGYLDFVLDRVDAQSGGDRIVPRYGDALAKLQYRFGRSHVVSVHGLYAGDQFRARDGELEASTSYGTVYGWMNWRAQLGERLVAHTVLSVGDLSWDRSGEWDGSRQGTRVSDRRGLTSAGARQEWSLGVARGAVVRWGWEWKELGASYDYSSLRTTNIIEGGQTRVQRDSVLIRADPDGRQLGAHLSAEVSPWPALTVEAGARGDRASYTDEVSWSPRLNVGYAVGANTMLRGAWGVYHQAQGLQSLQVQDGVSRFFPAERAQHRVVGIDHEARGVSFRAEAYQRLLTDVRPRYVGLDRALDIFPEVEDDRVLLSPERGEARGIELFAQRSGEGRVRWWAGYALARIQDEYDGRATPRDTDQRHTLNLGTAYVPGPKWRVSAAWRYHSGLPITARDWRSGKLDSGGYFVTSEFGPLYGERLPAYHRLDARVTRNWELRRSRVSAFLDVFNAYNRENARAYSYSFVTQANGVRVDRNVEGLLPILPSIGVAWEF